MGEVRRITSPYCLYLAGIIRNTDSTPSEVREALSGLGRELGRLVLEALHLEPAIVITPLNEEVEILRLNGTTSVVFTTKADLSTFGSAIASSIQPSRIGYMNFEGRRGLAALNGPIREISIPAIANVGTLVIGKSTLATGCTAVSLTRTALSEVKPQHLVIVTIFYSLAGLHDLQREFPEAIIFCVGDPDALDTNGMLHPGVGLLDDRI